MADRTRIAVVLIHGIGEPRPMQTLRGFADAVAAAEPGVTIGTWSKPFADSDLYDIRRIVMAGSKTRPVVDFYEFYWAHLMPAASVEQLLRWFGDLLARPVKSLSPALQRIYRIGWTLIGLAILTLVLVGAALFFRAPAVLPLLSGAATIIWGFISYPLLHTAGDAARYLDTRPDNVAARYAIQQAGVRFIERLHEDERGYRRIVVVGHSLGSMIGYDVLQRAWLPFSGRFDPVERRQRKAISAVRDAVLAGVNAPEAYRALQVSAHAEHLANGGHWRVSDFITVGSPLTHAQLLMATSREDLERRTKGRELVTCPPTPDPKFGIIDEQQGVWSPDHASVFALTRWTNVHAPDKSLRTGDPLSGPMAPVFGYGIKDVAVVSSHVSYWSQGPGPAIDALVTALDLTGRDDIPNRAGPGEETIA
jgi:hypothetical protein